MLLRVRPGGRDWVNLSAFSESVTTNVYKCREQRILNFVCASLLRILTNLASDRRAFCKKSRISVICFGILVFPGFLLVCRERRAYLRGNEEKGWTSKWAWGYCANLFDNDFEWQWKDSTKQNHLTYWLNKTIKTVCVDDGDGAVVVVVVVRS